MIQSLIVPRRIDSRTYVMDGRERYADTGRNIDERLGTHIVLWIVDDAEAWAAAVEADGDAEPARWAKSQRCIGEARREQAYESARKIRKDGEHRRIYSVYHDQGGADACVASLSRSHPNPGVRYLVAAIDQVDACPNPHCRQPRIHADGTWWHHLGRYPIECSAPPPPAEPEREPEPGDFVIDAGHGTMRCGWCEQTEVWPQAGLGYWTLTGFHLLGVERETNTLVVLAEATNLTGEIVNLPHHCLAIPVEQHTKYAPHTVLARPALDTGS